MAFLASPRVGIISQARMTSTRLPGKVLLPINGRPMFAYHVERLKASGIPVYLATTQNATDDLLEAFAVSHQIPFVRGDEHNVLSRYQQCAEKYNLDVIVRVTSDCPLIDGEIIAGAVSLYKETQDMQLYLSNVLERTFPRGLDFEIFSRTLLEEAAQKAILFSDLEHVTPYIHQNRSGAVRFQHITRNPDRSNYRLTVDTADDFHLLQTLIEQYKADTLNADQLISLLEKHPELVLLNAHVEQKKL